MTKVGQFQRTASEYPDRQISVLLLTVSMSACRLIYFARDTPPDHTESTLARTSPAADGSR